MASNSQLQLQNENAQEDCVICCLELTGVNQTSTECCSNTLHIACLFQWLSGQSQTCPFCRHKFTDAYKGRLKVNQAVMNVGQRYPPQVIMIGLFNGEHYPLGLIAQNPFRNMTRYLLVCGNQTLQFKVTGAKYTYFDQNVSIYTRESQPLIGSFILELGQSDLESVIDLQTHLGIIARQMIFPQLSYTQKRNQRLDLVKETTNGERPYIAVKEGYQGHYQHIIEGLDPNKILNRGTGNFIFHLRIMATSYGVFIHPVLVSAEIKPVLKSHVTVTGSGKCFL